MMTQQDKAKITLQRVIGLPTGILLVAGIMIGSGAFKKIAPMSAMLMNQSYILAAWIIAGIITLLGAFMLSGFAGTTNESGGVYEYLRLSMGNFISFIYGWAIFAIIGSGSIAALAFIFSQSVSTVVHLHDPLTRWQNFSVGGIVFPFASVVVKIIAVATICVLTWINCRGTKNGSTLNNIVTAAKVLGILFLIILGFAYGHLPAASNAGISSAGVPSGASFLSAIFAAMLSAFWAYDGWANVSFVTGEIKNPKKNVPLAIVAGLCIAMILYVLLNYAFMRVLPLHQLASVGENEIAACVVAKSIMGNTGSTLISALVAVSTFGALNACIIVYPRIYYRMGEESHFFQSFANVHPRFRTPSVSLVGSMVWSCVLVVTGTFDLLTNLVIFAGFFFYLLLAVGLVRLRRKKIITGRVIGYPVTVIVIVLFSLGLIVNTVIVQTRQSLIGLILLLSGVPLYYYFKRRQTSHP